MGIVLSLIGMALLTGIIVWAIWCVRRRSRRQGKVSDPYEPDPLQGEYSSWSEAMEDVEGVYATDYDGDYIDTDEYEAELDDYM